MIEFGHSDPFDLVLQDYIEDFRPCGAKAENGGKGRNGAKEFTRMSSDTYKYKNKYQSLTQCNHF